MRTKTNLFIIVFMAAMILLLLITGAGTALSYGFLGTALVMSGLMYWGGDDWINSRTPGQLRLVLAVTLGVILALSAWLLLSDYDLWSKVAYVLIMGTFVSYSLLAPRQHTLVTVNYMPRSDQTPQEFVESDED